MDELIQKAIKQNNEASKPGSSVPWEPDQPHAQPFYTYDSPKQSWEPAKCKPLQEANAPQGVSRLALFSWNIDFMLPLAKARMDAALEHLDGLVSKLGPETAVVIYLQECVGEDLTTIGEKGWVRDKFHVTDVDGSNWATRYGTTTLVDRRLDITSCFRVHYQKTRMQRDAFFVDVVLVTRGQGQRKTIRLCNTHLESLAFEPPLRPAQVQLMTRYMRADGVDGALAAGDFNAIQPFDRTLHSDNDLKDAYLELGGREDSDGGYTWGQQAATTLRDRFGCSRMDKVYFTGDCLWLVSFGRFGADVLVSGERERERIVSLGFEKPWITDHLGVVATVEVVE
ncbi:Endonuclease/exonuclease/phosphatase [Hypoxylon rubiginosum]|uniref:Endonuclease/exonuclease/phosphatase n=1 Tax=Hypoxylon rubiginosum TaxID=110542 RepID=A0ACB9YUZ3_9PEZI|nr:Endonuclease/exonuclease/phosphatase [Hypoxylon rubiginosum]